MKFNWGKGIIIACAVFIAGILAMVAISMTKNIDLVTPNYYEKEIKYQEEISKINNTNNLKDSVKIDIGESLMLVRFPAVSEKSIIKGEIIFYRPSDSKKDFKVPIEADKNFETAIDISSIEKGLWKVKMNWNMDGVDFEQHYFLKQ
jgi:hypothetical protein